MSDCPVVKKWAKANTIPRLGGKEDLARWLSEEPVDYLLSVVNHTILSPEVLRLPRIAAINYHDSLLPDYAGFNATAWSIIEGKETHGITWHLIDEDVDAGKVLRQVEIPITTDDTAFTLGAKCGAAGSESFGQLLSDLEQGQIEGIEQRPGGSFHRRSERPGLALLDWEQPAKKLQCLVRGLRFVSEDNWMTTPKVRGPQGQCLVVLESESVALNPIADLPEAPGTVVDLTPEHLLVSTKDGALAIHQLATLEGADVALADLTADWGIERGALLVGWDAEVSLKLEQIDGECTGSERFWVGRVSSIEVPKLNEIREQKGDARPEQVPMAVDAGHQMSAQALLAHVTAALASYLCRTAETGSHLDLGYCKTFAVPEAHKLYASACPLRLTPELGQSFDGLLEQVQTELASQKKRGSYARDIRQRYGSLRDLPELTNTLPIGISLDGEPSQPMPPGMSLILCVAAESKQVFWRFDANAISRESVQQIADRVAVLLKAALLDPNTVLGDLPLLASGERELLLVDWQRTGAEHDRSKCLHELFEEQVLRTPEDTALVFRDRTITYRELNHLADNVAMHLQADGVQPDDLVALCLDRSIEMVAGLYGILKAGAAYVPLDPAYPKERLALMLEDSRSSILLTGRHLLRHLPQTTTTTLFVDELLEAPSAEARLRREVGPSHLAYVIFTSGSSGRPKGVMVEHSNAVNFLAAMDPVIGTDPGVWLAVTSISFDISVLELCWTLARGFKVILQEESDRASLAQEVVSGSNSSARMGFSLFFFASAAGEEAGPNDYEMLLEGAKFADSHGFDAVWTPERHFHAFGGLYPSSAVTSAALATITKNVKLRAGSCVLPLHSPIRVAEEWSLIDNLSNGRVALSFASGWHVNDFSILPGNYENRREVMFDHIKTVKRLWAGETVTFKNGDGQECELSTLPRPVQPHPPIYISSAGNVETFKDAGRQGYNILTNMLGQDMRDLGTKLEAYHAARREGGFEGDGEVAVMLHTFVGATVEESRRVAKAPFRHFMETSFDLVKVAPYMFPAFKKPSAGLGEDLSAFSEDAFSPEDLSALLDFAFDRYFETAGIFGDPEYALRVVDQLKEIGVTEVACLVDFGIKTDQVLDNLKHLDRLRVLSNTYAPSTPSTDGDRDYCAAAQLKRHKVTHLQCTPSMARILLADGALDGLASLDKLLLGGEALPTDLAKTLTMGMRGDLINMYGPTETTVWSTSSNVLTGEPVRIGKPIANTQIRILDSEQRLMPPGSSGELCIGGEGVVRGYFDRPDLTADKFIDDPYAPGQRLYRTGDLARFLPDGQLDFLGRLDQQVKVNGYRIELGEIETILSRHGAVHENVVVTRQDGATAQLVAYVVSGSAGADEFEQQEQARVESWGGKWDFAYGSHGSVCEKRFDTSGWLSSYDGEPIAQTEMREWLDHTIQRALTSKPKRVLEIGCGTGMVLFGMLAKVDHYTALDLSPNALDSIRSELGADELAKVRLLQGAAHALERLEPGSFDLVIINSVCQYFPSQEYLASVMRGALDLLVEGGELYVGDVRNLDSIECFHTAVELHRAPGQVALEDLGERIAKRVAGEGELLLSPGFFEQFQRREARVTRCRTELKRGRGDNEMSQFRYDVHLGTGPLPTEQVSRDLAVCEKPQTLEEIVQLLKSNSEGLCVLGLQDQRLEGILGIRAAIERKETGQLESLRARLAQQSTAGVHVEDLYGLGQGWQIQTRPSRQWGLLDVLITRGESPWPATIETQGLPSPPFANTPFQETNPDGIAEELRSHVREYLPEYMVPTAVVVMDAFPLTANGKIDRKALPAPQAITAEPTEYAVPAGNLEETIAGIWKSLLNLERVGRQDNIFDLGAHSLLVVEANAKLSEQLGKRLPLVNMFRYTTIASLAKHLGGAAADSEKSKSAAQSAQSRGAASKSRAQAREEREKAAAVRRRAARQRPGAGEAT